MRNTLVQTHLFQRLGNLAVARECSSRVATHKVGNQHIPALGHAIAPRRSVVYIKAFALLLCQEGTTSSCGIGGVLHGVIERSKVGSESQYRSRSQYGSTLCQILVSLLFDGVDKFRNEERSRSQNKVVGDLRMVCSRFECGKKGRQSSSHPHIASQRVMNGSEHCRGVCQGPHLGYVAGADNEEEVGRESVGQTHDQAHPCRHAHQQRHHKGGQHRKEDHRGGGSKERLYPIDRAFDNLCRILDVDLVGRHAREHCSGPLRILVELGSTLADVAAHTVKLANIVLWQHSSLQLRSKADNGNYAKGKYRHKSRQRFQQNIFEIFHINCLNNAQS